MYKFRISERTIERLCVYRRILIEMEKEGKDITYSYEIGKRAGILDSQVRKDFSCFGQFGTIGRGYRIKNLRRKIEEIIGKNRRWRIALIGVGNLGSAILGYPLFKVEGFEIVAAFDNDRKKIGKQVHKLKVEDVKNLSRMIKRKRIHIGIIATPQESAQWVADRLIKAGVKAILNYAPCTLKVPKDVKVLNVDFCLKLEILTQFLRTRSKRNEKKLSFERKA